MLVSLVMIAVLTDANDGRIPNALIVTGLLCGMTYQIMSKGICGLLLFLGGGLFPLLIFSILYYFRMIGAGDIKLFCLVGSFLGPVGVIQCIMAAYAGAMIIVVYRLVRYRILFVRMQYFQNYMINYLYDRQWFSYMEAVPAEAKFCFSLPVLMGLIYYLIGGRI